MKRRPRDPRACLFDMLDNAKIVTGYIEGMSFEEFWEDSAVRDAVALRLAMIGEAAGGVDARTERLFPTIPFGEICGLRNRIVHDYGAINFRMVWTIASNNAPILVEELDRYFRRHGKQSERRKA